MRDRLEKYFIEVVEGRRTDFPARAWRAFFHVLSWIYRIAVQARYFLYRVGILKSHRATAWVISVGNITLGGTGKTPVVERLAGLLAERGRKVAVVSRGYRRKTGPWMRRIREKLRGAPTTRVVSDGRRVLLSARVAGDEPYMLAGNLEGVPILVNRNRAKGVQYAVHRFKSDAIILDDGFQHMGVKRDLDIVLLDAGDPFGNGHIFPRGILREPKRNLARADLILITKAAGCNLEPLKNRVREINPRAEILSGRYLPLYLTDIRTSLRSSLDLVKGTKVATLAAIARPEGFEKLVAALGAKLIRNYRYADHHYYRPQEILDILQEASEAGAELLLTTEKDAVRLPRLPRGGLPVFSLRVRIESMEGEEDFDRQLLKFLRQREKDRQKAQK